MRFFLIFSFCCALCLNSLAQKDSVMRDPVRDTNVDYDALFNELDDFLDSLLKPRSYTVINISAGSSFFDYSSSSTKLESKRQLLISPSLSYYSKGGVGISAAANIVRSNQAFNPYQYITTLSYDYLKNMDFVGGVSATHYITKDSLKFYTSPLRDEVYGYLSYRSLWFKPSVAASYGWGNRQSIEEREAYITALRLRRRTTQITTEEQIRDFNLMISVRHDYYWLNILTNKDFLRFTPQVSFTSGTQSYGLNQSTSSYRSQLVSGKKESYQSENTNLDERLAFQPLSLALALKSELSIGKFYVQPQVVFNYYIPATKNNLSTLLSINTGIFL